MKIKNRQDIFKDIIKDAQDYPKNWKAIFGKNPLHSSTDYYLFHPDVGMYLLKEYQKNPYLTKGVGGKIARTIDEDVQAQLKTFPGHFGIIQSDIHKITTHLEKGIPPNDIINAALNGKDLGLNIPIKGHVTQKNESYSHLQKHLKPKRKKIDNAFEKMIQNDRLHQGYD